MNKTVGPSGDGLGILGLGDCALIVDGEDAEGTIIGVIATLHLPALVGFERFYKAMAERSHPPTPLLFSRKSWENCDRSV